MAAKAYVVSMTVSELKEELKQRGLSTKGSKKNLRDRLEQALYDEELDDPESEEEEVETTHTYSMGMGSLVHSGFNFEVPPESFIAEEDILPDDDDAEPMIVSVQLSDRDRLEVYPRGNASAYMGVGIGDRIIGDGSLSPMIVAIELGNNNSTSHDSKTPGADRFAGMPERQIDRTLDSAVIMSESRKDVIPSHGQYQVPTTLFEQSSQTTSNENGKNVSDSVPPYLAKTTPVELITRDTHEHTHLSSNDQPKKDTPLRETSGCKPTEQPFPIGTVPPPTPPPHPQDQANPQSETISPLPTASPIATNYLERKNNEQESGISPTSKGLQKLNVSSDVNDQPIVHEEFPEARITPGSNRELNSLEQPHQTEVEDQFTGATQLPSVVTSMVTNPPGDQTVSQGTESAMRVDEQDGMSSERIFTKGSEVASLPDIEKNSLSRAMLCEETERDVVENQTEAQTERSHQYDNAGDMKTQINDDMFLPKPFSDCVPPVKDTDVELAPGGELTMEWPVDQNTIRDSTAVNSNMTGAQTKEPMETTAVQTEEPVETVETKELVEPMETSPAEEPVEAVQIEEPVETVQIKEPVEAVQIEEPVKTSPAEEPVEAVQIEEPVEAVQIKEPVEAVQIEEPVKTSPAEEPVEAVQIEEPVKTSPAEELVEAVRIEEPVEAVQIEEPVEAVQIEEPVKAVQIEEPVETSPAEEPVKAVETEESVIEEKEGTQFEDNMEQEVQNKEMDHQMSPEKENLNDESEGPIGVSMEEGGGQSEGPIGVSMEEGGGQSEGPIGVSMEEGGGQSEGPIGVSMEEGGGQSEGPIGVSMEEGGGQSEGPIGVSMEEGGGQSEGPIGVSMEEGGGQSEGPIGVSMEEGGGESEEPNRDCVASAIEAISEEYREIPTNEVEEQGYLEAGNNENEEHGQTRDVEAGGGMVVQCIEEQEGTISDEFEVTALGQVVDTRNDESKDPSSDMPGKEDNPNLHSQGDAVERLIPVSGPSLEVSGGQGLVDTPEEEQTTNQSDLGEGVTEPIPANSSPAAEPRESVDGELQVSPADGGADFERDPSEGRLNTESRTSERVSSPETCRVQLRMDVTEKGSVMERLGSAQQDTSQAEVEFLVHAEEEDLNVFSNEAAEADQVLTDNSKNHRASSARRKSTTEKKSSTSGGEKRQRNVQPSPSELTHIKRRRISSNLTSPHPVSSSQDRKRRWGSGRQRSRSGSTGAPTISSDLIQGIIPAEVRVDPLLAGDQGMVSDNITGSNDMIRVEEPSNEEVTKDDKENERSLQELETRKRIESRLRAKLEAELKAKKEMMMRRRTPSPPRHTTTRILHVENLTRPFTKSELNNLLCENGPIAEDEFWTDKKRSHCIAVYESKDVAMATRTRIHGIKWPSMNPKNLVADFLTFADAARVSEGDLIITEEDVCVEASVELTGSHTESQVTVRVGDNHTPMVIGQESKPVEEKATEVLDELFRKTKATPSVYWLPLNDAQVEERAAERREREEQRKKQRDERIFAHKTERQLEDKERERRVLAERERRAHDRMRQRSRSHSRDRRRR